MPPLKRTKKMLSSVNPPIHQRSPFEFSFAGKYRVFSGPLEKLGLSYENDQLSIDGGDMVIKQGMAWRSPIMAAHELLVFVGHSPLGKSSTRFRYGIPISCNACIVKKQLVAHREVLPVSRRQVVQLFSDDLRSTGFCGAGLLGLITWCMIPRNGWQIPD